MMPGYAPTIKFVGLPLKFSSELNIAPPKKLQWLPLIIIDQDF
jgi:hypothetical protein